MKCNKSFLSFSSSSGCRGELFLGGLGLPLSPESSAGDNATGGGDAVLLSPISFPFVLSYGATIHSVVPIECCSSRAKFWSGCVCFYKGGGLGLFSGQRNFHGDMKNSCQPPAL